jgi:hypothetical protein
MEQRVKKEDGKVKLLKERKMELVSMWKEKVQEAMWEDTLHSFVQI